MTQVAGNMVSWRKGRGGGDEPVADIRVQGERFFKTVYLLGGNQHFGYPSETKETASECFLIRFFQVGLPAAHGVLLTARTIIIVVTCFIFFL